MARQAPVPRNEHDPTSTGRIVAGATNNFNRRLNATFNGINEIIKGLEYTKVEINKSFIVTNGLNIERVWVLNRDEEATPSYVKREFKTNESIYRYSISPFELGKLNETIMDMINRLFMVDKDGNLVRTDNARQLWLMSGYVELSYEKGTAQAVTELSVQAPVYDAAVYDVEQLFFSQEYQRRIGYVAAREFELMQGFTADIAKDARFVLGDGIALGKSPREIAVELQSRIGVGKSRAKRIASTEVTYALRKAKRDEMTDADMKYGIKSKLLHMSAFKATSRIEHIARSGNLYTRKEIDDWYSLAKNAINCYCTQIITVLDNEGKPINSGAIDKVLKMKERFIS